jgi:hypothetical protein
MEQTMNTTTYANRAAPVQDAGGVAGTKRATEADRLAERMNSTMITLNGMVGRLSRSVDRISGSVPQGGETKADMPTPAGHLFIMDAGFNDLESALNRFRNEIDRLEAFA